MRALANPEQWNLSLISDSMLWRLCTGIVRCVDNEDRGVGTTQQPGCPASSGDF